MKKTTIQPIYYLAYGSNLDLDQMSHRCPGAVPLGTAWVDGYRLMHKGSKTGAYATIEPDKKCKVPVLVWAISKANEQALDHYEGHPTFYYKTTMPIKDFQYLDGVRLMGKPPQDGMVYIMHEDRHLGMPASWYVDILYAGYQRFGFPLDILLDSLSYTLSNM